MPNILQPLLPLIILLLPFRHVREGIDISDTGYNLACYRWFGASDGQGMWSVVTYLANMTGHMMMKLPGGDTWLGINIYTSLLVSALGLIAYYFLKKYTGILPAAAGVILALLLCWCPHAALYNYLTYFGLLLGAVILFYGIIIEDRPLLLVIAGLVLGMGVGTRFSNLTHMSLILLLWFDRSVLSKRDIRKVIRDTLLCVAGYAAGIGIILTMVSVQYGIGEYLEMIRGLGTMSANAKGYSGAYMITAPFMDYLDALWPYGVVFALLAAAGGILYRQLSNGAAITRRIFMAVYLAAFVLVLRICYGRGMFGLDYNEYFSIVRPASLFIALSLVCAVFGMLDGNCSRELRLLYLMSLIMLLILPLGSNNRSYPVINDLFIIAPMTLHRLKTWISKLIKAEDKGRKAAWIPAAFTMAGLLILLYVQAVGFGATFIFRDPASPEKRDTAVMDSDILRGMFTRASNAASLDELLGFWEGSGLQGEKLILYGDVPGLSYVLDAPSAISTTWSNLESYNMEYWQRDFDMVQKSIDTDRPVVIIGREYVPIDEKAQILDAFLEKNSYNEVFVNERFSVYY